MLKALKFDFYKLFKSKTLRIYLYITLGYLIIIQLINYFMGIRYPVLEDLQNGDMIDALMIGFVIFFIFQDYNRKFVKNIYRDTNKAAYVFSKFFIVFIYALAAFALNFIFTIILNYTLGTHSFLPKLVNNEKVSDYVVNIFLHYGTTIAYGFLIVALSFMIKNEIAMIIVVITYTYFLSDVVVYNVIDMLITRIWHIEYFEIGRFALIYNLVHYSWFLGNAKQSFICLYIIIFYIVTSPLVSWWLYAKRNV